ncbi:MAG: transposase [Nitrospirota bacterium]
MPRCARLDAPGLLHHVIARGIERRVIFSDDGDRANFLQRLARLLPETGTTCLAWCLLSNHLHLLVRSGPDGLAWFMRRVLTGYAVYFNRRYDRAGHLFQNRYHSTVCEAESYLLELVRYIHLNPVRAGLVPDIQALRQYPGCGHSAVMGVIPRSWHATDEVLAQFGANAKMARQRYEAFLQDGLERGDLAARIDESGTEPEMKGTRDADGPDRRMSQVLGRPEFVESVSRRSNAAVAGRRKSGRALLREVCRVLNLAPDELRSGRQERSLANGRAIVAYLGRSRYRLTGVELSDVLGLSQPAVSLAAQRGQRLLAGNAAFREALDEI